MEKAFKSIASVSTPIRIERTTSAAPISIDERLATLSVARASAEPLPHTSYLPIVVLVPNSAAFERVVAQLMPSHRSGLRLSESHILGGSSKAELPLESETPPESYSFGEVTVNIPEMLVKRNGRPINLPLKEFRIVAFMLKHPGRVIGRDELLNEVWGYQNYPCTRTVDNHILRLRQKLEPEPSNPRHFLTIHSAGYKFLP